MTITGNRMKLQKLVSGKSDADHAYSSLARGLMAGRIKSSQEAQAVEILDPFCVKGYVCMIILNVWSVAKNWQRKKAALCHRLHLRGCFSRD